MNDYCAELTTRLGSAVSTDSAICKAYDHDLGEMPRILLALFRRVPDVVVLPRTAEDVRVALDIAHRHGVPVTPRGQGTSGYGGSMPTRGGMLMDMSRMNRILEVNQEQAWVDVEPGVIWTNLEDHLAPFGLANRVCPTSGPSSTVGGFFSMGGMGIGSLRYGGIQDVVMEIDVVDPDGTPRSIRNGELDIYHQSQGCLGVITRLRLRCRPNADLSHVALHLPDSARIDTLLRELQGLDPFSASLLSAEYLTMQARTQDGSSPIASGFLLTVSFESPCDTEKMQRLALRNGVDILPTCVAEHEWKERFYPMRIKRNGPALLVGEFVIAVSRFHETWETIRRAMRRDTVGMEAFINSAGKIAVLVYIQDSAEDVLSLFRMGKAMVPLHIAGRFGGYVYAAGLWFNARMRAIIGQRRMERLLCKKLEVDPRNRMNPGKVCGGLRGFLPFRLLSWGIWIGTRLFAPISLIVKARPRRLPTRKEI